MEATTAGQYAEQLPNGRWRVSWLDGEWFSNQAFDLLMVAEAIADEPALNDSVWLAIERTLTELGLDPAVLDNLIDPEPDDEAEVEDPS